MLKGKVQIIFRIVIGLIFLVVGIKYFLSSDYLPAAATLIAGIAFIVSVFLNKNGKR